MSLGFPGPKLVPPEDVPSYPLPAAEGRGWKYSGRTKFCPITRESTTMPLCVTRLPAAWCGNSERNHADNRETKMTAEARFQRFTGSVHMMRGYSNSQS